MVVLGLLLLILAVVVAVGVISMTANNVSDTVMVFGYNFDLSRAGVFIFGTVVGALALLGLALLLSALRRSSHRRKVAELEHYRYEAESARQERDELLEARERQLEQERALHERHERELREVREVRASNNTPDAVDQPVADTRTRETADPRSNDVARPAPVVESRHSATDRDEIRDGVRADDRVREHKEGFWHRMFGSPAHRS